jgi:hypothetical protein
MSGLCGLHQLLKPIFLQQGIDGYWIGASFNLHFEKRFQFLISLE